MYQKGHDHYAVDIVVVWYNCSWFSDCHSSVSNPEITWDCKLNNHLAWSYGFLWASYKQALQCTVNWFLFSAVGLSISMWRQRGRVVRARSWVQIPFWLLADVVHDSPKFNFSSTLVNSQVVCLQPVGILNLVMFIITICLRWSWKAPMGSGQLRIHIHTHTHTEKPSEKRAIHF